jgi:hypothetical protein
MWEGESVRTKFLILEGESLVMLSLLVEDSTLVSMVKRGESKAACLNYINENW